MTDAIGLGFKHADSAGVFEDAAGFEDGGYLTKRFETPLFLGRNILQDRVLDINSQLVARTHFFTEPVHALQGHQVAAVDGIAEEDSGIELGNHSLNAGRIQGNRRMFARRSAAEILAGYD